MALRVKSNTILDGKNKKAYIKKQCPLCHGEKNYMKWVLKIAGIAVVPVEISTVTFGLNHADIVIRGKNTIVDPIHVIPVTEPALFYIKKI